MQIVLTLCKTLLYSQQHFHICDIIFKFQISTLQYGVKQGGVSVKFSDKPCSERMAIVQSCQVQMIKNLEVVGAFSAKKFFPEKIIFDDPPTPPRRQKNFGQYTILGVQKIFRTYQNFSRQKFSRYHKITQFLTKLTQFVPFFFIISQYCSTVKRILSEKLI